MAQRDHHGDSDFNLHFIGQSLTSMIWIRSLSDFKDGHRLDSIIVWMWIQTATEFHSLWLHAAKWAQAFLDLLLDLVTHRRYCLWLQWIGTLVYSLDKIY